VKEDRGSERYAAFRVVLVMLAVMWASEVVDVASGHKLDELGIEPREADGLIGVGTAPFLHAGFGHLLSNTLPFVILGLVLALDGLKRFAAVTVIVMLVGGLGTWLFAASNTEHIGASGVVFGYAAYLIIRGVFNRSLSELAVAVVVVLILGGALL
jgi:membrane associated rhomboid family serine protease